jgi:hypothetical protein
VGFNLKKENLEIFNIFIHIKGFKNARILEISLISNFKISVIMQHPNLPCYTTS